MADTKISGLPASTTPLAGTEVLPIVQSGVTKQVSVADLTAGRAVSVASVTASTGNFVVGTSGKGIDFSADPSAAGMTSELLDDYEEGTWTPVIVGSSSAGTATYSIQIGRYTKVGRLVTVQFTVVWAGGTGTGDLRVSGLPFNANNTANNYASGCGQISNVVLTANNYVNFAIVPNVTYMSIGQAPVGGGASTNVAYDAAGTIIAMATYEAT